MPSNREVIREWLLANLRAKGRGARGALAAFLGLRTEAISRMVSESGEPREVGAEELLRMAEFFGKPPPGHDAPAESPERRSIPVMGFIGAGASVEPDFEQVPPEGFYDVEVPIGVPDDAIGFEVKGPSMQPAYNDGDVIVVRAEQKRSTEGLMGDEAAIRTYDGKRYIKSVFAGSKRHLYTLTSLNAPPIVDVRIQWASEILAHVKARQTRKVTRKGRAPVRSGAAARRER